MRFKEPYFSFLILLLLTTINLCDAAGTIIKTIQSEDGDVINCVNISHQPAFDNPLLSGHTIQITPSNHHLENTNLGKQNETKLTQLWQLSGGCPTGTIPVRTAGANNSSTVKKPTAINASSSTLAADTNAVGSSRVENAIAATSLGNYYGAKASISAWSPFVENSNEFSLSGISLLAGSVSNLNTIQAGWLVYPQLFGDYRARIFIYWTRDNYEITGCYNLECPGFVQTSNQILIGGSISPTGSPYELTVLVWKDVSQNVWWLQISGITVGYWPGSIFTALSFSASEVHWGGLVLNQNTNGVHTDTDMGSGYFAGEGYGKASYFRNLQVVNAANTLISPPVFGVSANYPLCYNVLATTTSSIEWGSYIFYGGSGRNLNCP